LALLVAIIGLTGCGNKPDKPVDSIHGSTNLPVAGDEPVEEWIRIPAEIPAQFVGTSNCKFAFGQSAKWDYHPDGSCRETPGPADTLPVIGPVRWWRNQQHDVHIPSFHTIPASKCEGGPADVSPIRVCLAKTVSDVAPGDPVAGAAVPFHCLNPTTGPSGCAVCVASYKCETHARVPHPPGDTLRK
jgi:hypothetical protein